MPDADRTVIATRVTASDYVPDYAFTAIALNLDWGERHREVVVRCLRAPRDAVRGTASHIDEATAVVGRAGAFQHRACPSRPQGNV